MRVTFQPNTSFLLGHVPLNSPHSFYLRASSRVNTKLPIKPLNELTVLLEWEVWSFKIRKLFKMAKEFSLKHLNNHMKSPSH
jgi:hypothetical protein